MKRTLRLRREVLVELADEEMGWVVGRTAETAWCPTASTCTCVTCLPPCPVVGTVGCGAA